MSGGSYGYLYMTLDDPAELMQRQGSIEEMRDRLKDFPEANLALAHSTLVLNEIKMFHLRIRQYAKLADVWHAVEWRDSSDYGDDQVREALKKYNRDVREGAA